MISHFKKCECLNIVACWQTDLIVYIHLLFHSEQQKVNNFLTKICSSDRYAQPNPNHVNCQ